MALRDRLRDGLRVLPAMLVWNGRKTAFVLRGRRGRCPCHDPSDDGRPGETRCEAVLHWRDPARFRVVCPLLTQTPTGWRCSVGPTAVRPFWGRTFAVIAGLLLIAWLGLATAAFGLMRIREVRTVAWWHVAWPGAWQEIPRAQARALTARAAGAFGSGQYRYAMLCLANAATLDPDNYQAALLLAQISLYQGSLEFGDRRFTELLRKFPEQRAQTAVVYHDTLLGLCRYPELGRFCLRMVEADPAQAQVWMSSFLLAAHAGRFTPEILAKSQELKAHLPDHWQVLVDAQSDFARGDKGAATRRLLDQAANLDHDQAVLRLRQLVANGAADEAAALLAMTSRRLSPHEQAAMEFQIAALSPRSASARMAFDSLLRTISYREELHDVIGLVISNPDRQNLRTLHEFVLGSAAMRNDVNAAAMWLAAMVCGDTAIAGTWTQSMPASPPAIEAIDFGSRRVDDPASRIALVNTLTLPRQVVYSLFWQPAPE